MECRTTEITYAVLRGMRNEVMGCMQIDSQTEGLRVTLRGDGLPESMPLRLLLLSIGEDGAALDLGIAAGSADGTIMLNRTVPPVELHLWDALALAEDWPSGRLVAAAWLRASAGPVWRLAEIAKWYLSVPAAASPVS